MCEPALAYYLLSRLGGGGRNKGARGSWSARDKSFAALRRAQWRKNPRALEGLVEMDEFGDDLREARQENAAEAAGDEESDDGLNEESDGELGEESDEESDDEWEEVVRDAIRKLHAGETSL